MIAPDYEEMKKAVQRALESDSDNNDNNDSQQDQPEVPANMWIR